MLLSSGTRLGPYEVVSAIGAGGMGEVYKARDTRLGRDVAIKVLPAAVSADPERRRRFEREARAVSALNHPHICVLYDIGCETPVPDRRAAPDGPVPFMVMEYLDGQTLAHRLRTGPLPLDQVLDLGAQIADALAAAHKQGIVHRDLKPANIMRTTSGAKLLDFGLAKLRLAAPDVGVSLLSTQEPATLAGAVMGTLPYMAPEQLEGKETDARTDLFAFGAVLYEMVAGKRAFEGASAASVIAAVLEHEPAPLTSHQPLSPPALDRLVRKCLAKDPDSRWASAHDVADELRLIERSSLPPLAVPAGRSHATARPETISRIAWLIVGITVVLGSTAFGWLWHRASRAQWALQVATPEIVRLVDAGEFVKAAALIREARAVLPGDPTLEKLWNEATDAVSIDSGPSQADVSVRPYRGDPNHWQRVGTTPLRKLRVPSDDYVWRVSKHAFAPTFYIGRRPPASVTLSPEFAVPVGMVVVAGGKTGLLYPFGEHASVVTLDDYLIDRQEVTNGEYKRFVDDGAYQKPELWVEPFVKDGRTIPLEQAVAFFEDSTGRPGPATWEAGSFPKGLENHPVAGVSWFEAAAYARFVAKSLPTVYHWTRASQSSDVASLVAPGSNFSGVGTLPVGSAGTDSGFGTTDMAGNVKEWCWNESSAGRRFILGGGFGEPNYMFTQMDVQSPWERKANYGFRCVKLASPAPPATAAKLDPASRDVWRDKIASDEVFEAFKGLYRYDRTALNARVEETQAFAGWTREKVSFDAAYGNERVIAHLFLPRHAVPPFQTVVFFPSSISLLLGRFDPTAYADGNLNFLLQSGRAVVVPIFKGTFERRDGLKQGGPGGNPPAVWRDHVIAWSKDLSRSLDYLETRPDIDSAKVAYFGFSMGGGAAPVLLGIEGRFKAAILSSGGLWFQRALPEADGVNFVTRIKIPVLMLNGRYDGLFPVESGQLPVFRRLGTPARDKKHIIYEVGHAGVPHRDEVREGLDWLDKYLGPVRR